MIIEYLPDGPNPNSSTQPNEATQSQFSTEQASGRPTENQALENASSGGQSESSQKSS